jgi:hypothetical protein
MKETTDLKSHTRETASIVGIRGLPPYAHQSLRDAITDESVTAVSGEDNAFLRLHASGQIIFGSAFSVLFNSIQ